MTNHVNQALARQALAPAADAAPARRVATVVERCGYLADETVFHFVRDGIAQAVARNGIAAPVYVCHSLGCFVGLDLASREPGAIVIAINMPASPWHGFRDVFAAGLRMLRVCCTRGMAAAAEFRTSFVYVGRPAMDDLSRQRLKQARQQTNCYTTPRPTDIALFLKAVWLEHRRRGPHRPRVLLVQGDLDPIAPARDLAALQRRLPFCSIVTLHGAHVLPVTHPRDVVRAIEGFLAET